MADNHQSPPSERHAGVDEAIRRMEPVDPILTKVATLIVTESMDGMITPSRACQILKLFHEAREREIVYLRQLLVDFRLTSLNPPTVPR